MPATNKSTEALDALFERIARDHMGIDTLVTRARDANDFHDVAVWSIRNALEAAYLAGQQSGLRVAARG